MKLVLAGNFTLEPIARLLAGHDVAIAGFGDHMPVLAGFRRSILDGPEVLVVLLDGYEFAFDNGLDPDRLAEAADAYAQACADFAAANPKILLIASTIYLPIAGAGSYTDLLHPNGTAAIESRVRSRLVEASRRCTNLFVLDFARLVAASGWAQAANDSMRYFARFGFSQPFARAIAAEIEHLLAAALHRSKKVLALDLDNTLWGGLLGEQGPLGIDLSQDGKGRIFRHFQMLVRDLSRRGILIVALSKNNSADVDEIFARNAMMILRRDDFQQRLVDWRPKTETITEAARTLNLGLDAFVFIDDDPVEREAMRTIRPEVAVPDFPALVEALPRWFADEVVPRHFPAYRLTGEDLHRRRLYQAHAARATLRSTISFDDYLASLDIKLGFRRNDGADAIRLAQMTQKTNQFNLTTRRYSVAEIGQMIDDDRFEVLAMTYDDKFGQEGIIGLAILDTVAAELDSFLLSCRVIGRHVESGLLQEVERLAAERGCRELRATFKSTAKNQVSCDFLPRHGFLRSDTEAPDVSFYRKAIAPG